MRRGSQCRAPPLAEDRGAASERATRMGGRETSASHAGSPPCSILPSSDPNGQSGTFSFKRGRTGFETDEPLSTDSQRPARGRGPPRGAEPGHTCLQARGSLLTGLALQDRAERQPALPPPRPAEDAAVSTTEVSTQVTSQQRQRSMLQANEKAPGGVRSACGVRGSCRAAHRGGAPRRGAGSRRGSRQPDPGLCRRLPGSNPGSSAPWACDSEPPLAPSLSSLHPGFFTRNVGIGAEPRPQMCE